MKSYTLAIILALVIASCTIPCYGQIYLSNEDIYKEAEEFLDAEEFIEALPLFLQLEKKGYYNANIAYKIGECYLNIRGKKSHSLPYLEYAAKNAGSRYENSFAETKAPLKSILLLGIAYRIDNQLEKSVTTFKFLRDSFGSTDSDFLKIIEMHLQRCENARLLNAFPGEAHTERLPDHVNTMFSNYNPVLVNHDRVLYYMDELKFYDALMRVEYIDGEWKVPVNITPAIGSDGDHIIVSASADGKTLFLYLYEPPKAGEIYRTQFLENDWSDLELLNENINTVYHETHASISADGKTLYFTSNREGGIGGMDIYKSELDSSNNWGPAVNLGPVINTPYNEETPIINSEDEILFFSSQGHLNMGGYDVFYALKKGDKDWYRPVNMGSPVCTTDDDLFYYPLEEQVSGMMSRIEQPSTGYDIYQYNSMAFTNSPRFSVMGKSDYVDTSNYRDSYIAIVNKANTDTVQYLPLTPDGSYDALLPAGDFEIVYFINDEPAGSDLVSLDETNLHTTTQAEPASKLTGSASESTEAEVLAVKTDTFFISRILFPFDSYTISDDYKSRLDSVAVLLKRYPSLILGVEGYTDALGTDTYNNSLSLKRAMAVAGYIASKDINNSRLPVRGHGEAEPVAPNTCSDGRDNPEGRKYNRRVVLIPKNTIEGLVILEKDGFPQLLRQK